MSKVLVLQCPKCKNKMKYQGRTIMIGSKRKACVYCGNSFVVKDNVIREE